LYCSSIFFDYYDASFVIEFNIFIPGKIIDGISQLLLNEKAVFLIRNNG